MSAQPQRALDVLADLLEQPAAGRDSFLAAACGGDQALRHQVEALIAAHGAAEAAFPERSATPGEQPGDKIHHYHLLQKIGEGGFGVVWMAEQEQPVRRKVALKVLKAGMDTAQVVGRFEAERQALALMDHPNIAQVFDGGSTASGRPFFVMELVRGIPITKYCDEGGLSPRERLELFVPVCRAVQHAHNKGVIHRDLKPNNVLVTLHDGLPVPKVIDFGIAKATSATLTQRTVFTEFRQMLGTPEYMAPEQAEMSALDVDTRADIYSLGVLLYELLTGTRPFELKTLLEVGFAEMVRTIKEVDPPKPSTRVTTMGDELLQVARQRRVHPRALSSLMRDDLDWIVMKALEKERNRRYETATALAEDVLRHLRHEPVLAGPPSRVYRFWKYVRRHRSGVAVGALVAVLVVAGALASGLGWLAEARQADRARVAAATAERVTELLKSMLGSSDPHEVKGRDYTVRELLDDFDRDLAGQLRGQPAVEATLRATMASSYLALGLPAKAETHVVRTLELRRAHHGEASAEFAEALLLDAQLLHDRARYPEAASRRERGVSILRDVDREGSLRLAAALSEHGDDLDHLARFEEAETHCREALVLYESLGDRDGAAAAMVQLANVLRGRGRYRDAEALLRPNLAPQQSGSTPPRPHVAMLRSALGGLRLQAGDLQGGEQLLRQALDLKRQIYGDEHRVVAGGVKQVARACQDAGRLVEAERLYDEALAMQRRLLGNEHSEVADTLVCLAGVRLDRESLATVEPLLREALSMQRRIHGERHPAVATTLNNLAVVLVDIRDGRYDTGEPSAASQATPAVTPERDEARRLLAEALTINRETFGDEHPKVAQNMVSLAFVLPDAAEAERLRREGLGILRRVLGASHPMVAATLASHTEGLGAVQAESQLREALRIRKDTLGDAHPATLGNTLELAAHLRDRGSLSEATEVLRAALPLCDRLGEWHPHAARVRFWLAQQVEGKAGDAEAETLYREALAQFRRAFGPDHREALANLHALEALVTRQGRHVEAESLARERIAAETSRYGAESASVAMSRNRLGWRLLGQDRLDEAEAEFRVVEDLAAKLGLADRRWLSDSLHGLGVIHRTRHRLEAAATYLRRALAIREQMSQPGKRVAQSLLLLGMTMEEQGDLDGAEAVLSRSLGLWDETGSDPGDLANNRAYLGRCCLVRREYQRAEALFRAGFAATQDRGLAFTWLPEVTLAVELQGRRDEAAALRLQMLDWRRELTAQVRDPVHSRVVWLAARLQERHHLAEAITVLIPHLAESRSIVGSNVDDCLVRLGSLWLESGDAGQAEPLLREGLDLRSKTMAGTWRHHNAMSLLGDALLALGRLSEAEPLLVEAATKIAPPEGSKRREALARVVALYEALEQPDQAAVWRQRLATLEAEKR